MAVAVVAIAGAPTAAFAKPKPAATAGYERLDGLLPVFVDRQAGKVLLKLPAADADGLHGRYLYQIYLRAGLGSNPVGLDRSAPGATQVLAFRRAGAKVVVQFENHGFIATNGSADEKRAVRESFAVSNVWSTEVVSREADGSVLIDVSGFLTRDALGVARALKDADQGDFRLDGDLSFADTGAGAGAVFRGLYAPERLNRLVEARRRDSAQPGVEELLGKTFAAVSKPATGRQAELARRVRWRLVVTLANAQRSEALSPTAAALIRTGLADYGKRLAAAPGTDPAERAFNLDLAARLPDPGRLAALADTAKAAPKTPPGPPIGEDDWFGDLGL